MTKTQQLVLDRMREGHALVWFGDNGPEMNGFPFWPQKRTVRTLLRNGYLKWGRAYNATQEQAGIIPLKLVNP